MNQKNRIWQSCLMIIIALNSMILTGCTAIRYDRPDGTTVTYVNFGFNRKIGDMTITSTDDNKSLHVKDLDSNSRAFEAISEALKLIPKAP